MLWDREYKYPGRRNVYGRKVCIGNDPADCLLIRQREGIMWEKELGYAVTET